MSRHVTAAAVRLSNEPSPTSERLHAAETQVVLAAQQGAQLVVLPELFNTGYTYYRENYARAEPIDGPTVRWMKRLAAENGVHLAGALLLLGPEHITNSLILVAPDGRLWRYDKHFPWVWERLYFREGRDITVAHTDLGTFGLMICADVMMPNLFRRYAGKVDALVISSSPPLMHELELEFPGGERVLLADLMGMSARQREAAADVFGPHVRRNAAWLGVPVVNAIPYGTFSTRIPIPWLSFGILLARHPSLWARIPQGNQIVATARYFAENQIVDASGTVLAQFGDEADGFALATFELPDSPPLTIGDPPRSNVVPPDTFSWVFVPFYRRGVRAAWGRAMAPVERHTRTWTGLVLGALLGGYILGRLDALRRRWLS